MIARHFIIPDDMWSRIENGELLYAPITAIAGDTHTHIYLSGQTARLPSGVLGAADMRGQIRQVCQNMGRGLGHVGATFDDVVQTQTFVLDIDEYSRHSDEIGKFFTEARPANTVIQIMSASIPGTLVAMTCEAVIETGRFRRSE